MRELPILMNGGMVRALLDGRKTQTRRLIKPKALALLKAASLAGEVSDFIGTGYMLPNDESYIVQFAKYQVGDLLYVRERARVESQGVYESGVKFVDLRYEADSVLRQSFIFPDRLKPVITGNCLSNGCYKEVARIWREVTGVRVERIQDITIGGIEKEGVSLPKGDREETYSVIQLACKRSELWLNIWQSLYPGSWGRNDWVFVYEFKRIEH